MYTSAFTQSYKASKSKLPIHVWAEVVGKRLPQFKSVEDVYAPIPLCVKIAGSLNDSNGTVKLSVQPSDPRWYENLVEALGEMTGQRNIEVQNYLGKPIKHLSPEQLVSVGECDCVDVRSGRAIRLAEVVAPPLRMSTNKQAELRRWWGENQDSLSQEIAKDLVGLSMAEIAKATLLNGPVQKTIERYLVGNTLHDLPWEEFLSTYGNGRRTSSADLSKTLLDAVRQSLQANEHQVRKHQATVGSEASLWKTNTQSSYKDDFTLYRDIVEDALYHPFVTQKMVQSIMQGTLSAPEKPRSAPAPIASFHPLNAYYQQHHYGVHGKLPGHRIEELNRNNGQVSSRYPGDPQKAIDMFNLLTGRGVQSRPKISSPIPLQSAVTHAQNYLGVLPIAEAVRHAEEFLASRADAAKKKKKKDRSRESSRERVASPASLGSVIPPMPGLIPLSDELIACHSGGARRPQSGKEEEDESPRAMRLPVGREMPRLIPISAPVLVPSDRQLGKSIWVDDAPNLEDFL